MAFYSISSYSPFKINSNVLTPGVLPPRPVPPFSLDNSFRFTNSQGASSSTPKEFLEGSNVYSELDQEYSFAVSLWVKFDLVSRQQSLFFIPSSLTNSGNPQFQITMESNQIRARYRSGQYIVRSNIDLLTWNTWTHILVTRDQTRPSGSRAKIFINGVDETLTDGTGSWNPAFSDSVGAITMGRNAIANNQQFAGNMTEVSVYKQDMASFVSEIYNGGVPNDLNSLPTAPQPTTWFRMGENAEWNGTLWNLQDVINAVSLDSSLMVEANRVTSVPPTPAPTPPSPTLFSQKSFRLDGIDDVLTINTPISSYTGELTFSIWFNQASEYGTIFFGNVGGGLGFCLLDINANNKIRMRFGSSSTITFTSSTETIERYEWNHLLLTRNSSNSVSLFVNGVSFASSQTLNGSFDMSLIGGWGSGRWAGILDEIALWKSDESANVSTIYNAGVPGDISTLNPDSWWRADGDTPQVVLDNGSDSQNLTMTNFTTFSTDVPT
jgi:hypothetical protein